VQTGNAASWNLWKWWRQERRDLMNSTRLRLAARTEGLILFRWLSLICLTLWKSNQRWPPHEEPAVGGKTQAPAPLCGHSADCRSVARWPSWKSDVRFSDLRLNLISFQFSETGRTWWRVLKLLHVVHQQIYKVIRLIDKFYVDLMWARDVNVSTSCDGRLLPLA